MARSGNYRIMQAHQVLDHLAADRKKAVFAVSLLAVMGFMWFRVLTGHQPAPAAADTSTQQGQPQKPPRNIHYLELPNLPGRNDYINRDFFASRDWECFRQNSGSSRNLENEVHMTAPDRAQEVAARLGQRLKLEAVLRDGTPRAFINDQLLRLGDRLPVHDGPDTCEFEVLRIYEDSVLVGCNGTQLTLKLTQHLDVNK
jgi:hypothetical protein